MELIVKLNRTAECNLPLSDVDAPVAWAVLEFALFGEVRYC